LLSLQSREFLAGQNADSFKFGDFLADVNNIIQLEPFPVFHQTRSVLVQMFRQDNASSEMTVNAAVKSGHNWVYLVSHFNSQFSGIQDPTPLTQFQMFVQFITLNVIITENAVLLFHLPSSCTT
jgi:hypothetical protein